MTRTKLALLGVALLLSGLQLRGQAPLDCNGFISLDQDHVLTGSGQLSASPLLDQGADAHILVVDDARLTSGLTMRALEADYEKQCPSWTIDGHRKPNLFVLMVSPKQRKKNVFFGAAYSAIFPNEDSVNTIYSQAANPFFKQGDFVGGLAVAVHDFGAAIAAYHDQAKHPVQQTTVEQATDLHGLWVVLGWIVGLVTALLALFGLLRWMRLRREAKAAIGKTQVLARLAKHKATTAYQAMSPKTDGISQQFLDLSNSVSNDPDTNGYTATEYEGIRQAWQDLYDAIQPGSVRVGSQRGGKTYDNRPFSMRGGKTYDNRPSNMRDPSWASPTVVNNNSGSNDLLTGVLVGEALSRSSSEPEEPRRREPDPEPEPVHSSSSGSDSSWGSSSSSDDSYGGSDSSFDSGSSSSDFGGGGSDSSF